MHTQILWEFFGTLYADYDVEGTQKAVCEKLHYWSKRHGMTIVKHPALNTDGYMMQIATSDSEANERLIYHIKDEQSDKHRIDIDPAVVWSRFFDRLCSNRFWVHGQGLCFDGLPVIKFTSLHVVIRVLKDETEDLIGRISHVPASRNSTVTINDIQICDTQDFIEIKELARHVDTVFKRHMTNINEHLLFDYRPGDIQDLIDAHKPEKLNMERRLEI